MNRQVLDTSETGHIERRERSGHSFEGNEIGGSAQVQFGDRYDQKQNVTFNFVSKEPYKTTPTPSTGVPFRRDSDFVDRGNLLGQIEERCAKAAARVALVGIGGVGKSQLAIEYCHRVRKESPSTWIFWVHASNAERIEQGYREIAEQVKLAGREDSRNNIFELVARWLRDETNGKWLLVLDNADDDVIFSATRVFASSRTESQKDNQLQRPLAAYLPQSMNGTLLVTSRTRSVATKLAESKDVVQIEPMAVNEAVALLQKKLELEDGDVDNDLKELASALEYMPLALVQAAAFILQKGPHFRIQQYLEEFHKNDRSKTSLLNHEAGHLRRDEEAKNSVIVTWQISFDYLRARWPSSADLLSLMSFFDRQRIPKEALIAQIPGEGRQIDKSYDEIKNEKGRPAPSFGRDLLRWLHGSKNLNTPRNNASDMSSGYDSQRFQEDIDRLQNYSFVSVGPDRQTFGMHRLVQLATRKWLEMYGEYVRWRWEFYQKLDAVFPSGEYETWSQCERLFPHARVAERYQPADEKSLRAWGELMRKAGWYALGIGNYSDAEAMYSESVRVLRTIYGSDDKDVLLGGIGLACVYWSQQRWAEAEELELKVIEVSKRVFGEEDPNTLNVMRNLASTYADQGRLTEAEELELKVMEGTKRVFGEENPDTLDTMHNLAATYADQGRLTEAEELQLKVLKTQKRVLGHDHPDTAISMVTFARIRKRQGREAEAIDLLSESVRRQNRLLGNNHPYCTSNMETLAAWQDEEQKGEQ